MQASVNGGSARALTFQPHRFEPRRRMGHPTHGRAPNSAGPKGSGDGRLSAARPCGVAAPSRPAGENRDLNDERPPSPTGRPRKRRSGSGRREGPSVAACTRTSRHARPAGPGRRGRSVAPSLVPEPLVDDARLGHFTTQPSPGTRHGRITDAPPRSTTGDPPAKLSRHPGSPAHPGRPPGREGSSAPGRNSPSRPALGAVQPRNVGERRRSTPSKRRPRPRRRRSVRDP